MANISAIKLPNGTTYTLKDNGALQLTGGQVTGPVIFGDSVTLDEVTISDLVVNGSASFTNNIQANTINGVTVGNSPKFTDTNTEVSTLTLVSGSTAGTSLSYGGKYTLTAGSKTVSFTMPASDNTNTTYTLSNALSSHKFTETLTAGGSGSGTSTATMEFVAGTGITLTDDTTNKKITIACSVTNTDTKVSTAAVTSGTMYYPVLGANTTSAATKFYDSTGISYTGTSGTVGDTGASILALGNNIHYGTANNKIGYLRLYGSTSTYGEITGPMDTEENYSYELPAGSGILVTNAYLFDNYYRPVHHLTATLTTTWSSKQQSVSVSYVNSSNTVIVSPAPASYDAYCAAGIYCSAQGFNSLTFTCDEVPTASLTVNILVIE